MSAEPSLAAPGSSSYSSNTMHVGDGTWNAEDDTFLLPNIQGLNFATTRYNGMGNRFRSLNGYHSLVTAHGVLAAITFLLLIPAAILIASFYHRNGRLALRLHIGIQVFVVILTTVIFVLGYFAVGPARSLTNPHHGIGLALYLFILLQAFGGWVIKRIERGKQRLYLPVKLMLHQWVGRGIAILGFAQVPIGLALYGSPKSLFVVYSLWMAFLLVLYFILVHRGHKRRALGLAEYGSYTDGARSELTESRVSGVDHHTSHHRLEKAAGILGLGAAVTALRRRSSGRHRTYDGTDVSSVPPSNVHQNRPLGGNMPIRSEITDKSRFTTSSEGSYEPRSHTWRNRLLAGAATTGGIAAARNFFRRKPRDDVSSVYTAPGPYRSSHVDHASASAVNANPTEEGRPLTEDDDHWRRVEQMEAAQQADMARPGGATSRAHGATPSRLSQDSYVYEEEKPPRRFGRFALPMGIGALGGLGGMGNYFRRRRERKEDERVEAEREREHEIEDRFRAGASAPVTPRHDGASGAASPYTDRTGSPIRHHARRHSAAASTTGDPIASQISPQPPPSNIPPPPRSTNMGPPPPMHGSPPSTAYTSPSRAHRSRPSSQHDFNRNVHVVDPNSPISSPPAAAATGSLLSPPRPPYAGSHTRTHSSSPHGSGESPAVSVKIKTHPDGRHVTLRRLGEEEAARERENRRREQRRSGRQRRDSDLSDEGTNAQRFRRDQTPSAPPVGGPPPPGMSGARPPPGPPSELHLPPQGTPGVSPPSALGPASTPAGTDITDFDERRRRRRAERARTEQERNAQRRSRTGSPHVEFT